MEIVPGNAWWQGCRTQQQDAFGFFGFDDPAWRAHAGVLMVLADGMGGMHGGREASRLAVARMMATYGDKTPEESIPEALARALADANAAVYDLARRTLGEGEVGTTLVAAAVLQDGADCLLYWVGVGDSRLYLYQATDATLTCCTEDHTHANALREQLARGELTAAEVAADPDGSALVSFLGLREIPRVDRNARPWLLRAGDRLLVASDGVWGTLPEAMLADCLAGDAQAAADGLIDAVRAQAAPNQDNATAAVLTIGPAGPRPSAGSGAQAAGATVARGGGGRFPFSRTGTGAPRWHWGALAALLVLTTGIGIGVRLATDGPAGDGTVNQPVTGPAEEPVDPAQEATPAAGSTAGSATGADSAPPADPPPAAVETPAAPGQSPPADPPNDAAGAADAPPRP